MAASKSISANTSQDSDAFTTDTEATKIDVEVTADNNGTPADGEEITVRILGSTDGTTYESNEHAIPRRVLNTYPTDTPGEDPAIAVISVNPNFKKFKVRCTHEASSGNAITVSGYVREMKPDGAGGVTHVETELSWPA